MSYIWQHCKVSSTNVDSDRAELWSKSPRSNFRGSRAHARDIWYPCHYITNQWRIAKNGDCIFTIYPSPYLSMVDWHFTSWRASPTHIANSVMWVRRHGAIMPHDVISGCVPPFPSRVIGCHALPTVLPRQLQSRIHSKRDRRADIINYSRPMCWRPNRTRTSCDTTFL